MAKKKARKKRRSMKRSQARPTRQSRAEVERVLSGALRRQPRAQHLPGMEDRAIQPLEQIAAAYADIRDQRIALNREDVGLKKSALRLMKKFGKVVYHRDGIEIRIVPGEDDIKVKIRKPIKEAEADDNTAVELAAAGDELGSALPEAE